MSGLSVILATRNGAQTLGEVLEGYRRCRPPGDAWRLVVVDNASTDATPRIIAEFRNRLPLQVLHQPQPGKNRCLNLALDQNLAELVVLTDDDAAPDPGFLCAWERMLSERPEFAAFGGRIEPRLPQPSPDHLEAMRPMFAELYAQNLREEGETTQEGVFGPNMAVRRAIFDAGMRFDPGVGPDGSNRAYGMGSESEFCDRLSRLGQRFWFNADASVTHLVRPSQMTRSFIEGRAYRHGYGVAYRLAMQGAPRGPLGRWIARARWRLHRALLGGDLPAFKCPTKAWERNWRRGFLDGLLAHGGRSRLSAALGGQLGR